MSSILSTSLPTQNSFMYPLMAATTATARCVKVAQPKPYNPGSVVSTFTTTRLIPSGAVAIAFTFLIFTGGSAFLYEEESGSLAIDFIGFIPSNPAADPSDNILSASLRVFLLLINSSCTNKLKLDSYFQDEEDKTNLKSK